jgi:hypothetical protein
MEKRLKEVEEKIRSSPQRQTNHRQAKRKASSELRQGVISKGSFLNSVVFKDLVTNAEVRQAETKTVLICRA